MGLAEYRASAAETERTADLLRLMPAAGKLALDIGARDGYFSLLMAERFDSVIALDLEMPAIEHEKVLCVEGNAASLPYEDESIDLVFCAEVLEHIPTQLLHGVCRELERVCRGQLLIGVPYRQDIRVARTTCYSCLKVNPPWGHVNSFDEGLAGLFPNCKLDDVSFVGSKIEATNAISVALMDLAGNPYGTYMQDEPCIHCGQPLRRPPERGLVRKALTRLAVLAKRPSIAATRPRPNWMHLLLSKSRS